MEAVYKNKIKVTQVVVVGDGSSDHANFPVFAF